MALKITDAKSEPIRRSRSKTLGVTVIVHRIRMGQRVRRTYGVHTPYW